MIIPPAVAFIIALALIVKGADWIVDGATHIARVLLIPEFVIGATIVAFGTSLPELGTSIAAMYAGLPYIVTANVIGSNLANIALVLGFTSFIYTIWLRKSMVTKDLPFVIGSSIMTLIVLLDYKVTFYEGMVLLLTYAAYALDTAKEHADTRVAPTHEWFEGRKILPLFLGFAAIYYGARLFISSANGMMEALGITETVLGFVIIAIGTSLPELVTSLKAASRGRGDLAMGNVIGSNTFNSLGVLGIASFFGDIPIEPTFMMKAVPLMVILTMYLGFIVLDRKITRFEGVMYLFVYGLMVMSVL